SIRKSFTGVAPRSLPCVLLRENLVRQILFRARPRGVPPAEGKCSGTKHPHGHIQEPQRMPDRNDDDACRPANHPPVKPADFLLSLTHLCARPACQVGEDDSQHSQDATQELERYRHHPNHASEAVRLQALYSREKNLANLCSKSCLSPCCLVPPRGRLLPS